MTASASVRVMSPEEIVASGAANPPPLLWPDGRTLFADRQMRLRQLAQGHAMAGYLDFMANLAGAQHAALQGMGEVALPEPDAFARAAQLGLAPLDAGDWPRAAAWRDALRAMVGDLRRSAPGAGVHAALDALTASSDDELELQAECLLTGVMSGLNLATAPVIAGALQVYWTHLVASVRSRVDLSGAAAAATDGLPGPFRVLADTTLCPCCGSRPTASVTRSAGGAFGQRYLHCSLCSLQWHLDGIRCAHCLATEHLLYQSLEVADASEEVAAARAARAAVQAETCGDCGHYLKIMHRDRNPLVDPVADDLATVTLDLLVSEGGRLRHGVNLMLLFGDPEPPPGAG